MKEEDGKSATSIVQSTSNPYTQPWIFKNQELLTPSDKNPIWEQKKLINKLNYINFNDGHVILLFQHKNTKQQVLIKASPHPCKNNEMTCHLDSSSVIDRTNYEPIYLLIDDGIAIASAPVQLVSDNDNTLKVILPEKSQITTDRKSRRHHCHNVTCEINQDDFNVQGTLKDFTPSGLGIKLSGIGNGKQLDSNKPVQINLAQNGTKIFSGLCQCIRNGSDSPEGRVIYAPIGAKIQLFEKREMRNPRQHINPSFKVCFRHPLFPANVERDILEISTSGFSLWDSMEEEILLPGMIIPHLTIVYAGTVKMDCSAQVVYREEDKENKKVKCGLAITDMNIKSFSHLNHILGVYLDGHAHVSTEVDMDALWEFFFDTGFIYGEKYQHLQPYSSTFKETYRKLYEPSWLIHHFAARRMKHRLPGVTVLKQITQYISSYNRLPSAGMDYVMTYYQPNNKVIDRIFGAFTRHLKDLRGSSLDLFSYMSFQKEHSTQTLPDGWVVRESTLLDLAKLKDYYQATSGGLLLSALGLDIPNDSIKKTFADAGFKRDYQIYCLFYEDRQMAFFVVNQSDIKLNLSDLINGIKIIVVEPDILSWPILKMGVNYLSGYYSEQSIPLLFFPSHYLPLQNIPEGKQYALWMLNLRHSSEDYLAYMNRIMKLSKSGINDGKQTAI
jgi:hypothetical protein